MTKAPTIEEWASASDVMRLAGLPCYSTLIDRQIAYLEEQESAANPYPAGTVVFVPDGEPRRLRPGDWYGCEKHEYGIAQTAVDTIQRFQVYRRIVIGDPPAPEKGKTVRERVDEILDDSSVPVGWTGDGKRLWRILADAIDALAGERK